MAEAGATGGVEPTPTETPEGSSTTTPVQHHEPVTNVGALPGPGEPLPTLVGEEHQVASQPTTIYTPLPLPTPIGSGPGGGVVSTGGTASPPTTLYPGGPTIPGTGSQGGAPGAGGGPLGPGAPTIGDGAGNLTATDILKLLGANFLGAAAGSSAGGVVDFGTGPPEASDAWDYFRGVIDTQFTGLESAFETIGASPVDAGTAVAVTEVGLGVAADIEAVDVVGLSLFVLGTEYGFGWLVTKVAAFFPDPSLFGWHPLGFIRDGLNNLGKQFEQSARDLSAPVVHLFTTPVRQLLGLFQRIANTTVSAHNKIAHVVTDLTPALIHDAVTETRTYAETLVDNATTTAATYTDTAIHAVEHTLSADVENLNDNITKAISDTLAPIHDTLHLIQSQLGDVALIGGGTIAATLATQIDKLTKLTTQVDTCTVDTCDPNKPNNVTNVVKRLLEGLTAAGEIGFIAEAAANPEGTAAALAPFLEGIDTAAQDTFHTLFGEL